ncbi:hypothetical protein [Natronorubrum aibiense]|nr:hypothetical protein [Natronorubrum aibiense]
MAVSAACSLEVDRTDQFDGEIVHRAGHCILEERLMYVCERLRTFLEDAL